MNASIGRVTPESVESIQEAWEKRNPNPVRKPNPVFPSSLYPRNLPPCFDAIPKIIHLAWLGPRPISDLGRHCIQSWRKHHPGWEVNLWCDAESSRNFQGEPHRLIDFPLSGLYHGARNFGEKSDILRYLLMLLFGGLWSDCDVECLRPCDPLLAGGGAFLGAGTHPGFPQVENAILASCPNHPLFASIERALPAWCDFHPFADTIERTGPVFLHNWCRMYAGEAFRGLTQEPLTANSLTIYPESYWYHRGTIETAGAAFGFHWWEGAWYR